MSLIRSQRVELKKFKLDEAEEQNRMLNACLRTRPSFSLTLLKSVMNDYSEVTTTSTHSYASVITTQSTHQTQTQTKESSTESNIQKSELLDLSEEDVSSKQKNRKTKIN